MVDPDAHSARRKMRLQELGSRGSPWDHPEGLLEKIKRLPSPAPQRCGGQGGEVEGPSTSFAERELNHAASRLFENAGRSEDDADYERL